MDPNTSSSDVIVIGGGAAGIMAALSVREHHPDYSVTILDRTFELGRKFLTSGAGRGNLTNVNLEKGPDGFFHGDQTLIRNVFSQYGYRDIMKFFDEIGVPVYEEKKTSRGKIFPVIDNAKTVRDMLLDVLAEKDIKTVVSCSISSLKKVGDVWHIASSTGEYSAKYVILSAGGMTYPALGADGSGYDLAKSVGHTMIPPVVVAVPVVSKNALSHFLQGEKMVMEATSIVGGKDMTTAVGDVMFTQYGFSGPAIFDVSHEFSVRIHREHGDDTTIRLSFFPGKTRDEAATILDARLTRHASLPVAHSLWGLFTEKTSGAICAVSNIPKERLAKDLSPEERERLLDTLTAFTAVVADTRGWNEGEFTSGGVETSEIDTTTLESLKAKGLFFAGEILNVDGQVGGFNLSWAWSTGYIAGKLGSAK
jgi:predicted Rossmann fold flavoprotein